MSSFLILGICVGLFCTFKETYGQLGRYFTLESFFWLGVRLFLCFKISAFKGLRAGGRSGDIDTLELVLGYWGFVSALYSVLLGYWGFGDALYNVLSGYVGFGDAFY